MFVLLFESTSIEAVLSMDGQGDCLLNTCVVTVLSSLPPGRSCNQGKGGCLTLCQNLGADLSIPSKHTVIEALCHSEKG